MRWDLRDDRYAVIPPLAIGAFDNDGTRVLACAFDTDDGLVELIAPDSDSLTGHANVCVGNRMLKMLESPHPYIGRRVSMPFSVRWVLDSQVWPIQPPHTARSVRAGELFTEQDYLDLMGWTLADGSATCQCKTPEECRGEIMIRLRDEDESNE